MGVEERRHPACATLRAVAQRQGSPRRRLRWPSSFWTRTPGEIKALVGGRDYGESQLNHVLARRQPGSAFKPFVYAAAFEGAVDGVQPIVTPATTVMDEPTTFDFDGKEYTPNNYGEKFHGKVTLREALTDSLNVATVKVAELVGYTRVTDMAHQFGLDPSIQPTPSVALGAYEMTPLEVAAGYTIFANEGVRTEPMFIRNVVNAERRIAGAQCDPVAAGARSARRLPGDQHDGGRHQPRHGRDRSRARIHRACGGKTGYFTRRLVCRLHLELAGHRLGGI